MNAPQPWRSHTEALGALIRAQRQLADLSLREMATMTQVSNAYLSQIERGLHQPSVRIITAIAHALNVPPDQLLAEAGLLGEASSQAPATDGQDPEPGHMRSSHAGSTEEAIRTDPRLTEEQRQALLGVYRSFVPPES